MQAWVIAVSMVISSWNVQNPLLFRCSCFIRSHLQEYSYHPVSLSLLCPLSLILLLSLPPSFFLFFTIASLSLTPAHPSYSKPARLHLFFLTSLSFLPVFQPWLFPPSFSVTPSLSRPISLTFRALLSFPLCPFFCLFCYALSAPTSFSLFLFPLLFLEYVIFHTSWHHQSSISHWPCIHPDINQLVLVSWSPIFTHLIQQSWNILIYSL